MVIGVDTSGSVCSVAAVDNDRLICEFYVDHKKTHSEALVPMLKMMLDTAGFTPEDADCIAVTSGPGSFTGLRIGAATAKGLALSLNKPIVGVSSLLTLSYNLCHSNEIVCPIMDARRNEVYTAAYKFNMGDYGLPVAEEIINPAALPLSELITKLNEIGESVIFLGDGVKPYKDKISEIIEVFYHFAAPNLNMQRAGAVAVLGQQEFLKDGYTKKELELTYLRRPQAERERLGL